MRAARHRALGTGHGGDLSASNHEFQKDPVFSRASTYTVRSGVAEKKARSRGSFWEEAATMIARACTSCFAPRESKIREGPVKTPEDAHDVSTSSISRISSVSSTSTSQNKSWPDQFSFQEVCLATSNFSEQNKIGKGNFGTVYKAKLRDGSIIAVKRAKKNMFDRHLSAEFRSEIQILSKVEHLNLVKFLGHLEHQDERLILVEYISNGTLREHLDGSRGQPLELSQRLNIAIDIAHAVAYLHGYTDNPIIHRDIKPSNILLTDQLRAKVSDFGFARLSPYDTEATHISTMVKGTVGYVDPEYLNTNHLTERSDVYSFGVLLVELITGRRPVERNRGRQQRLSTEWALRKCREGDVVVAMDPRMRRTSAAVAAVERVMALAAECAAMERAARPAMRRCAEVLWSVRRDFQHEQQRAAGAGAGAGTRRRDGPTATYGSSCMEQ
ncbi:calmodulin-binding receptor-like cytoplasmic kinase 2 isoform X2 [Triticum urartu]|uniref:non-specific serine/threonine protein kinase n=2 Tax=Triticum TaxID=4564 RepID=A0A3B6EL03_WHEAT|nr:calmodulin-binding receptor-like cytoplasmic kinase 2 isoform X2 [Triticum dicoccoides]XP_044342143.1 calmodulin-binding receptor-like cytoplasmic kinase 2 [Triticum aestivum]XP_048565168.1 calmodulin-binding receptor-like cytoplasmic kinase 2 isoform X2 [Triticum urartu]